MIVTAGAVAAFYQCLVDGGTLDGTRVRILQTSLDNPGGDAGVLECADGPLWVLESENPEPAD